MSSILQQELHDLDKASLAAEVVQELLNIPGVQESLLIFALSRSLNLREDIRLNQGEEDLEHVVFKFAMRLLREPDNGPLSP